MKAAVLLAAIFAAIGQVTCQAKNGSVILTNGRFLYKVGIEEDALAYGTYDDAIQTTGWGVLDITASRHEKYTADQIMYAAGLLEGAFTSERIYQHFQNLEGFLFDNRPADIRARLCDFLGRQEKWLKSMVMSQMSDKLWKFANYSQSQIEGLYAGYQLTGENNMTKCDIQILNAVGDIIDLLHVLDKNAPMYFEQMSRERLRRYAQRNGHCSVLIKVTPGFENIFMGHDSWFVYSAMLRIYKHYDLKVFDKEYSNSKMSFSSYPGFLNSLDDFYILGSGMVMLQTTNNIYNTSLYDLVVPEALLAWQRVRIANFLATNGKEWGEIIRTHNSGTYNNQYMIVDLKKFTPNKSLQDGALYVVEQIPGLVESKDQTAVLRQGYWASYNVPFYETIYNISGYAAMAARNPDNSHDLAPRAKIFRRDQHTVTDMEHMKRVMRFNDFKHDEYSEGDACNSICCRGDLQFSPSEIGCYDTKVTDYFMAKNLTSFALSGPTVGGDSSIPVFKWTPEMPYHKGMPEVYNFPFVTMKPKHF